MPFSGIDKERRHTTNERPYENSVYSHTELHTESDHWILPKRGGRLSQRRELLEMCWVYFNGLTRRILSPYSHPLSIKKALLVANQSVNINHGFNCTLYSVSFKIWIRWYLHIVGNPGECGDPSFSLSSSFFSYSSDSLLYHSLVHHFLLSWRSAPDPARSNRVQSSDHKIPAIMSQVSRQQIAYIRGFVVNILQTIQRSIERALQDLAS